MWLVCLWWNCWFDWHLVKGSQEGLSFGWLGTWKKYLLHFQVDCGVYLSDKGCWVWGGGPFIIVAQCKDVLWFHTCSGPHANNDFCTSSCCKYQIVKRTQKGPQHWIIYVGLSAWPEVVQLLQLDWIVQPVTTIIKQCSSHSVVSLWKLLLFFSTPWE